MDLITAIELRDAAIERLKNLKAESVGVDGATVSTNLVNAAADVLRWDRAVSRLSGSRPAVAQINLGG